MFSSFGANPIVYECFGPSCLFLRILDLVIAPVVKDIACCCQGLYSDRYEEINFYLCCNGCALTAVRFCPRR